MNGQQRGVINGKYYSPKELISYDARRKIWYNYEDIREMLHAGVPLKEIATEERISMGCLRKLINSGALDKYESFYDHLVTQVKDKVN